MPTSQPRPNLPIETLLSALNWRYAVKRFDPTKKIPSSLWKTLEDALVLTASSYGLQPWRFIVVTDAELKAKLRDASHGQSQVTDCSYFLVITVRRDILSNDYVEQHLLRASQLQGVPRDSLNRMGQMLHNVLEEANTQGRLDCWQSHQVYIALGNFLTCAALLGVDTCPMEGFLPEQVDQILNLNGTEYRSLVCCAAGYRSAEDKQATRPKVRFSKETLFTHI